MASGTALPSALRRPLSVYADDENPRHASWLELFFDLVFVVAIAELGAHLHHDPSPMELVHFAGLFVLVWWIWLGFSYYADLYDTEDPVSRLATVGVMFGVIFLAETIDGALHGDALAFGVAVLVLRLLLTGSHLRARSIESDAGAFLAYWIGLDVLTTLVWAVSLVVPVPGRYGLWLAAFALNVAGMSVIYTVFDAILVQVSHMPERLGLFTILVLGETIVAVGVGTNISAFALPTATTAGGGFLVAVGAWWLYFVHFDDRVVDRALRVTTDGWLEARERALVYVFGHYPVHAGIVAGGVGIATALDASLAGHPVPYGGRLALAGGIAAFLVGSGVCHYATSTTFDGRVFRLRTGVGVAVVFLPVTPVAPSPPALVGTVSLALVALAAAEAWLRGRAVKPTADPGRTDLAVTNGGAPAPTAGEPSDERSRGPQP